MDRTPSLLLRPGLLLGGSQVVTAIALIAWAEFGVSDQPAALDRVAAVLMLVLGALSLLAFRAGIRAVLLEASAAATLALLVVVVATRVTPQGQLAAVMLVLMVLISVLVIVPAHRGWAWAAAALTSVAGAALANPVPVPGPGWFIVLLVLGSLSVLVIMLMRDLREALDQLDDAADHDPLTGLLNRRGLTEAAPAVHALSIRTQRPVHLVVIDLDGFKAINDTLGHAAGDALLVDLARTWSSTLRESDLLARVGGDEFVLVLPGTYPPDEHPVPDAGPPGVGPALARLAAAHPARWSHGVTQWRSGEPWEDALARADEDLYDAKRARRA